MMLKRLKENLRLALWMKYQLTRCLRPTLKMGQTWRGMKQNQFLALQEIHCRTRMENLYRMRTESLCRMKMENPCPS